MKDFFKTICVLVICFTSTSAWADAAKTCKIMENEKRLGPFSYDQCLCNYAHAEKMLDDDLKALLFESWQTGKNNMKAVEKLKPRRRIKKQMQKLSKAMQQC